MTHKFLKKLILALGAAAILSAPASLAFRASLNLSDLAPGIGQAAGGQALHQPLTLPGNLAAADIAFSSRPINASPIGDADLFRLVRAALRADAVTAPADLEISIHKAVVKLKGAMGSEAAIEHAVWVAAGVPGVRGVDDRTVVIVLN